MVAVSRRGALTLAAGAVVAAASGAVLRPTTRHARDVTADRTLDELDGFVGWLARHQVAGMITEVGWPSHDPTGQWEHLARRWLDRAASVEDLWLTYWATGEVWNPATIPYLAYRSSAGQGGPLDQALAPGRLLERYRRDGWGVNSAGGSYNACTTQDDCTTFSNRRRGRLGKEWRFDGPASFAYLARRGVRLVRLPVRWERLQPARRDRLDVEAKAALTTTVEAAGKAGLSLVIDLHNFGAYYEASSPTAPASRRALGAGLTVEDLVDVWRRLSDVLAPYDAVVALELMNEPRKVAGGAAMWEQVSSATVAALRDHGESRTLIVDGYEARVDRFPRAHAAAWIDDPLANVRYGAQHYWDRHHGADYSQSYDAQNEELSTRD